MAATQTVKIRVSKSKAMNGFSLCSKCNGTGIVADPNGVKVKKVKTKKIK